MATHKAADGTELEIMEVTDAVEPFKLFSLQVKSSSGVLLKATALDLPFGYGGGFRFLEKDGEIVIEKDSADLRYLASYWLSDNNLKKSTASCPACAIPSGTP